MDLHTLSPSLLPLHHHFLLSSPLPHQWKAKGSSATKLWCSASAAAPRPHSHHTSHGIQKIITTNRSQQLVRTLLIDNYDSYTYNLYQLLAVINGVDPIVVKNDELSWMDLQMLLYEYHAFDNIVISPGPGSPLFDADIGICMQVLQLCHDIPILGVCMGHQALGYANGAKIIHAPMAVHGRLSEIEHNECPLFENIPSGARSGFKVVRYHSLMLDADSLPDILVPTAWTVPPTENNSAFINYSDLLNTQPYLRVSGKQPMNGRASGRFTNAQSTKVIMAISHRTRPHYGLQFHPESIATAYGERLLKNFCNITRQFWKWNSRGKKHKDYSLSGSRNTPVTRYDPLLNANAFVSKRLEIFPSVENKANDVNEKHSVLRLSWERLDGFATQIGGSENIFCVLLGEGGAKDTFWLDSSCEHEGRAHFSYMGGKGGPLWRCFTYQLSTNLGATQGIGTLQIEGPDGYLEEKTLEDGFFNWLNDELDSWIFKKKDQEGLPFDFCGGFVGYLGYELKAECGASFSCHKSQLPDASFFFVDRFVAIDHLNGDVYVLALYNEELINSSIHVKMDLTPLSHKASENTASSKGMAELWVKETLMRLFSMAETGINLAVERRSLGKSASCFIVPTGLDNLFSADKCKHEYMNDVMKCLEYIKDGESYELCLTTQSRRRIRLSDNLSLYLNLRKMNPAPYAAWLQFGKEDIYICCSSPERFLKLNQIGILEAKPIKGTTKRGSSPHEDGRLKWKLQNSEKDQAENLMIVDLLRNDLGRVCKPGSVHVPSLMAVESYATVHTLVSTIRGKKRDDVAPIDCVRAAFPGGSMTGAPKLRAMDLLDSIECGARGVYSGGLGFFSVNSSFDLNIVIRTLVIQNGMASIGAGGAIVALSDPEDEYEEMLLKARAPIRVVAQLESVSNVLFEESIGIANSDLPQISSETELFLV